MRVIVCGGRSFAGREFLFACLDRVSKKKRIKLVIHGGATGADSLAAEWATAQGIHTACVKPLWERYGRNAGPIRNIVMLFLDPAAVIAFPGGRGTADMVKIAKEKGGIAIWEPRP